MQHSVNKLLKLKVAAGIFGRQECCSVSRTRQEYSEHKKKYSFVCVIYAAVVGFCVCVWMCAWMKAAFKCCSMAVFGVLYLKKNCYILCRIASISFCMSTWCLKFQCSPTEYNAKSVIQQHAEEEKPSLTHIRRTHTMHNAHMHAHSKVWVSCNAF